MKKFITVSLMLILLYHLATLPIFAVESSYFKGMKDAERYHGSTGYLVAGSLLGFIIGPLLGGGGTVLVAALSNPTPSSHFASDGVDYEYIQGYTKKARTKNMNNALYGSLIALGLRVVLFSAIIAAD